MSSCFNLKTGHEDGLQRFAEGVENCAQALDICRHSVCHNFGNIKLKHFNNFPKD